MKINHVFGLEKVIAFMHELRELSLASNRLHQISGFRETFYSGMKYLLFVISDSQ